MIEFAALPREHPRGKDRPQGKQHPRTRAVDLFFRVFDDDRLVHSSEASPHRNLPPGSHEFTIEVDLSSRAAPLKGRLFTHRGAPAAGVTLRFYLPGFAGTATLLGEAVTGGDGAYTLAHDLAAGPTRLEVRAVGVDGAEIPLLGPDRRMDLDQPLSLVVPADRVPPPEPEFARLNADLQPHLNGGMIADAREDGERRDLTLLHEATGWDARLIALVAYAERLGASLDLEPEGAYGLLRAGLPADPVQLARVGPIGVGNALRTAVESGVVSLDDGQIAAAQETVESFGNATRRKLGMVGTVSSYGSMLAASGLTAAQQDRFDEVFYAHDGDAAQLWQEAGQAGLPADQLQLTAQLGVLTFNNAPLVERLRDRAGSTERLADTLVAEQLYQPSRWEAALLELADRDDHALGRLIPPVYQGETVEERLQAYAADLAYKVRRSYPTKVLGDRIRSGELPLAGADTALAQDVATALDRAAQQGFMLGHQPLHRFLDDQREALFEGIEPNRVEAATAELAALYRQYQLTSSDEGIAALQQAGLRSAYQISTMPEQVFLARHVDAFPNRVEAAMTWRRAQQVTAVTLNLVATAKQLDSLRLLPALAQPGDREEAAREALIRQMPTLESLFGSLDFCECRRCRSVLSPAAYLVDVLKFLDDATASPATPYEVLAERRPDLPHLPLTCENTHTAMPYIDIVNEILEFYLANDAQLTPEAAYDTGSASTADLLAEPQRLLPEAYDLLIDARYPLTAPFDLWLATVRAFTGYFDTPFWQLLDALRPSDAPHPGGGEAYGYAAVAYERLGFSAAEIALLTAPGPLATWPELYGYAPDAAEAEWGELRNARTLSRRLGVTYHELLALLRTRFANPAGQLVLVGDGSAGDDCSWEDTQLRYADGTAVRPIDLLLLNYLVRVWRRLGWSVEDTDAALVTFLPTVPDPRTDDGIGPAMATALLGVAHLDRLAGLLELKAAGRREALVLWGRLSDDRYAALFLTGTTQTRDPVFEGEPGIYLTTPGVLLADHLEPVQAAFRLTAGDIRRILRSAGLDPATAPLTMDTVSLLHRYGLMARWLKLDVADLVTLEELSGLEPFTPPVAGPVTTAADDHPHRHTIRFVETVQALDEAGLSVADLDYLLRHRLDPVGPYRSAAAPPLTLVRALASEVNRVRAEHAVPADPLTFTDEVIARTLALVLDPVPVVAFLDAWTGAAPMSDEVFDEHLRRRVIAGVGRIGFLEDADRAQLFDVVAGDQAADAARRARLAEALLPYVQDRLIRRLAVETVAADRDGDPSLVDALLTKPALLDDPDEAGRALLDGYVAAAARGLTVEDGVVTGYLEVPASGGHQFTARCAAAGTGVALRFDHLSEPVLETTSTPEQLAPDAQVELRAGVLYGFTLEHTPSADVELVVRSRQLAPTPVADLVTHPRSEVAHLHRLHLLLGKTLRLADVLGLAEVELRHLLTHPDDFDGLDLSALPTDAAEVTDATARAQFAHLLRLVGWTRLRGQLAAEPGDLVAIVARARRRVREGDDTATLATTVRDDVTARLSAITRREPDEVRAAADLLGMTAASVDAHVVVEGFTDERGLTRLWRILALVTRLGADPAALGRWATPDPDHAVARDLRNTVKARYAPEQWRRVAQPIFDRLRRQRRDALVAQTLRVTGYERPEQLFEHFLVDPQTEPVVQTSRLRLAISSVQTFVQRCLLNLEPRVAPSAIDADHWQWMNRYRVWEANRKIFLWPENWLEPEFRDDKTHLFAKLEGALLDSDLDDHVVEAALFRYLGGLEEIARLDVRAICREEKAASEGSVLHVVARTVTAPHRYFYRTWSHRSWTPWVPVTATIDGDHLAIMVWQGRLHLFWATFLLQTEASTRESSSDQDRQVAQLTVGQIGGMQPRRRVEAQLHWSCYFQGEWSEPVLAKAEAPVMRDVGDDFDAAAEFIWARPAGDGVLISLLGQVNRAFRLRSRHAPPRGSASSVPVEPPYVTAADKPLVRTGPGRWKGDKPKFRVHVEGETIADTGTAPCDVTEDVFARAPTNYELVIVPPPAKQAKAGKGKAKGTDPANRADDPFYYIDEDHTFFVEPTWAELSIGQADQAIVGLQPVWHDFDRLEYWAERRPTPAFPGTGPELVVNGAATERPSPLPLDPVIRPETVIAFDGALIGATGRLPEPGRLFRTGPHGALTRIDVSRLQPRS